MPTYMYLTRDTVMNAMLMYLPTPIRCLLGSCYVYKMFRDRRLGNAYMGSEKVYVGPAGWPTSVYNGQYSSVQLGKL